MKNVSMLVWLTQLGLSVALPPVGFVLLSVWLRNRLELGSWIVITGVVLGVIFALSGLIRSLMTMNTLAKEKDSSPVSYNEHE